MEPKKSALSSKSGSEKASGPWRPTKRQVLWAVRLVLVAAVFIACVVAIRMGYRLGYVPPVIGVLLILIRLGYRYEWTGFRETWRPKYEKREIQPQKTLWDWMQLLFVPAMLAVLVGGLTWWQTSSDRARQVEEAARQEALRAQNTAVQAYLDQMSALMLEKDLRASKVDSEVRTLAQARTSVVLQAVGPETQRTLLQFLSAADLIQRVEGSGPIISLDRVDLSHSDLRNIALSGSNLSFANLSHANLSDTNLRGANLRSADLDRADLNRADLSGANLSKADLSGTNLLKTDLRGANLSGAFLFQAGLIEAYLSRADLSGAGLWEADLNGAHLSGANLTNADLSGAYLGGAGLSDANLSNAKGVTEEQLKEQAKTLKGATMPDGSKHP